MKVDAAVRRVPGQALVRETLTLGDLRPDEIIVAIGAVGICHTDLSLIDGRVPGGPRDAAIVPGHEGAGHVVRVGAAVTGLQVGDPVVLSFRHCGVCAPCCDDHPAYCHDFRPLNFSGHRSDGSVTLHAGDEPVLSEFFGQSSFATHAIVAAASAISVPDDVPLEVLAPFGCGFQTGAGAILNVLRPRPQSTVAVFGCGSVGLAMVMAARIAACARIVAIDREPRRLALARELGASDTVAAGDAELVIDRVRALTGGMDFALDATGSAPVVAQAFRSLRPGGTAAFVGTRDALCLPSLPFMQGCVLKGVTEGDSNPGVFIPRLIELWRAGQFPVERLIRTYPFSAINQAIADVRRGTAIKAVVLMPGESSGLDRQISPSHAARPCDRQ